MRYTDHEKGSLPYELNSRGVEFSSKELDL
jgi:hypothetical protein